MLSQTWAIWICIRYPFGDIRGKQLFSRGRGGTAGLILTACREPTPFASCPGSLFSGKVTACEMFKNDLKKKPSFVPFHCKLLLARMQTCSIKKQAGPLGLCRSGLGDSHGTEVVSLFGLKFFNVILGAIKGSF